MVRLGRVTVLVRDIDEAKAFYGGAFGFETLFDEEIGGGFRAVHVGPEDIRGAGLWLMPATRPELEARVGNQTAGEPMLVLYTDDLTADLDRLARLDVVPHVGPQSDAAGAKFSHVRDNSGNEIVLVQLPG